MLKKVLLASAVLVAATNVVLANPVPYIGAGVGVATNTSSTANFRGAPVSLLAGYGGIIAQSFYLAGELTGIVATGDISDNGPLKTTYGFGLSMVPGVMLSDRTLGFARAGFVRTRFSQASTSQTGGQFGLGLQTSLTQSVDLRGEYDYTAYSSFNNNGVSNSPRTDAATLSLIYKFN
jgi:opacity protein-like surface antigen